MLLETRHLKLVQEIAEQGGVTKASKRLFLTQSAVSHQLLELERKLGTALFHRAGKRMVPTAAGSRVLSAARNMLDELQQLTEDLRRIAQGQEAVIRLSTECYTCYHWLPRIIADFAKEWPDVSIHIVPEATRSPHEAVSDARVDVAIVYDHIDAGSLQYTPLFDDELVAVVSPSHPFAKSDRVHPTELGGQHLILYDIPPSDSFVFRHILGPDSVVPTKVSRLPLTEAILEMVRANIGMSILARWAVAPQIASGQLVGIPLDTAAARRRWSAARRIGGAHPRFENAFVALLSGALLEERALDKAQPLRLA